MKSAKNRRLAGVISVGDGIANIYGIDHAMYGEIVVFENGLKGMVQDIRQDSIGCILFGKDTGIRADMKVTRYKEKSGYSSRRRFCGTYYRRPGRALSTARALSKPTITVPLNRRLQELLIVSP